MISIPYPFIPTSSLRGCRASAASARPRRSGSVRSYHFEVPANWNPLSNTPLFLLIDRQGRFSRSRQTLSATVALTRDQLDALVQGLAWHRVGEHSGIVLA